MKVKLLKPLTLNCDTLRVAKFQGLLQEALQRLVLIWIELGCSAFLKTSRVATALVLLYSLSACATIIRSVTWGNDPQAFLAVMHEEKGCTLTFGSATYELESGLASFVPHYLAQKYRPKEFYCTSSRRVSIGFSMLDYDYASTNLDFSDRTPFLSPTTARSNIEAEVELYEGFVPISFSYQSRLSGQGLSCNVGINILNAVFAGYLGADRKLHVIAGTAERVCYPFTFNGLIP